MSAERWRKIEEAFERAIELPREQRGNTLSGLDDTIRAEVEALIARAEEKDNELPGIVERAARRSKRQTLAGRRLGPYRLVTELGRGGMGAVYLATRDDDEYKTEVAIKVLHRGVESQPAMARFRDERQILATLDHPNIVRLLDGGTSEDGLPYLVMERVHGVPITKFAADRTLSIDDRIALFRTVCRAVQYAHTKLVIHRDLKPSNILVTGDGTVKLLDFGIAKLTDTGDLKREAETRTGMLMLTPEYASPEQIRGEVVSTASDVYSLGAVLYELLTGVPPHRFDGQGGIASLLTMHEAPPQRPSLAAHLEHRKQLAGDLDNIILKALDRDLDRRYGSVDHFAQDLQRHVDGMPVEARAATWSYRAGKFIRRNRLAVAGVATVAIALTSATIVSVQQARRAEAEKRAAEAATRRAEQRFADVRALANTLLFDVDERISSLSGATAARELIVGRALAYLDKLAAEVTTNAALNRELATAYMKIGDIQGSPRIPNLGHADQGLISYQKAADIITRLASTEKQDLEVRVLVGSAQLLVPNNPSKAREDLTRALELATKLPTTPELQRYVVLGELAFVEIGLNALDGKLGHQHAAHMIEVADRWSKIASNDSQPAYFAGVGRELAAQADTLLGDPEAAVAQLDTAHALFADLEKRFPDDARYRREAWMAVSYGASSRAGIGLGDLWLPSTGDRETAYTRLAAMVEQAARAVEADPVDIRGRLDLALFYVQLALIGTESEALATISRARRIHDSLSAQDREGEYAKGVEWFLDCASAAPLALVPSRRVEAIAMVERARRHAAAASYPNAIVFCEALLHPASKVLDPKNAATALANLIAQLRTNVAAVPDDLVLRRGLADMLALDCATSNEAIEVWKTWPGQQTSYTRRHEAELETNAHACEKKSNLRE